MPEPVSFTENFTLFIDSTTVTFILIDPSSVNFIAFDNKLIRIYFNLRISFIKITFSSLQDTLSLSPLS